LQNTVPNIVVSVSQAAAAVPQLAANVLEAGAEGCNHCGELACTCVAQMVAVYEPHE